MDKQVLLNVNGSIVGINVSDDELTLDWLKGPAITVEEFYAAIKKLGILDRAVKLHRNRKAPYRIVIDRGSSGRRDYYIQYLSKRQYFYALHQKHLLHISMNNALNEEIDHIWLGDLIPIMFEEGLNIDDLPDVDMKMLKPINPFEDEEWVIPMFIDNKYQI